MELAEPTVRSVIIWMLLPIDVCCVWLLVPNVLQGQIVRLVTRIGLCQDQLAQISVLKGFISTLLSVTAQPVAYQDAGYAHQLNAKPVHQENTDTISMEICLAVLIPVHIKVRTLTQ